MAVLGIVIGSETDSDLIQPALEVLGKLGIEYEFSVMSAHRTPEMVRQYGLEAEGRGLKVIIAAAGRAAHLPGVLASWTTVPVIGVPLATSDLKGLDSLLSIAQMPSGVPVACMGIGPSGAKNAALLAAQILATGNESLRQAYGDYKRELAGG